MTKSVKTVRNTKVSIGGAATTNTPLMAEFTAATFINVASLSDLGDFGGETAETTDYEEIDAGFKRKLKGIRDYPNFTVTVNRIADDAGQLAMRAAVASDDPFLMKMEKPDASIDYFAGLVLSAQNGFGEGSAVIKTVFEIAITHVLPEVIPA